MATASVHNFMQYLHARNALCHSWPSMYRSSRHMQHTLLQCIQQEEKYWRWKLCPGHLQQQPVPLCQKYLVGSGKALITLLSVRKVCSGLQERSSPLAEARDGFCHGFLMPVFHCTVLVLSWHRLRTGLPNLAVLQGLASQSKLMIFAAATHEQTRATVMETIPWLTQEDGNFLLQLPSCRWAVDRSSAPMCQGPYRHLQVTGTLLMAYQWQLQGSSPLFTINSTAGCMGGGATHRHLPNSAGVWGHPPQMGTGLTFTRVIFLIQNRICYHTNVRLLYFTEAWSNIFLQWHTTKKMWFRSTWWSAQWFKRRNL